MEGQEFLTINPDTLSDPELWSYQDLQKIAKAVGLRANCRREALVQSLDEWHRSRKDGTQTLVENTRASSQAVNLDMNVVGNNFAILAVKVVGIQAATEMNSPMAAPSSPTKSLKRKFTSIVGFGDEDDDVGVVNSTYLRPLRPEPATPGKSCLKRISSYCDSCEDDHASEMSDPVLVRDSQNVDPMSNIPSSKSTDSVSSADSAGSMESSTADCCRSHTKPPLCSGSVRRLPGICFSPFNGVRVIAHREVVEAAYAEEEELQRELDGGSSADSFWFQSLW